MSKPEINHIGSEPNNVDVLQRAYDQELAAFLDEAAYGAENLSFTRSLDQELLKDQAAVFGYDTLPKDPELIYLYSKSEQPAYEARHMRVGYSPSHTKRPQHVLNEQDTRHLMARAQDSAHVLQGKWTHGEIDRIIGYEGKWYYNCVPEVRFADVSEWTPRIVWVAKTETGPDGLPCQVRQPYEYLCPAYTVVPRIIEGQPVPYRKGAKVTVLPDLFADMGVAARTKLGNRNGHLWDKMALVARHRRALRQMRAEQPAGPSAAGEQVARPRNRLVRRLGEVAHLLAGISGRKQPVSY